MATPVPPPPSGSSGSTNLGMAPNVGALLCYVPCCIGLIFSIVVAIVEKQSRFLRFHAFQSLLLHGALIVFGIGYQVIHLVVSAAIGFLVVLMLPLGLLISFGCLALLIYMMIKANANEEYELPVIGKMARQWV